MRYAKIFITLILVLLVGVYIRGWTSLEYDKSNKEVRKTVVFTRQMVWVSSLPEDMVGRAIARKYGSMLREKTGWLVSKAWFPDVETEDIPCDMVFTVTEAFYDVPHGILESIFSDRRFMYYVLKSEKYNKVIVTESAYEAYSEYTDSVTGSRECIAAVE